MTKTCFPYTDPAKKVKQTKHTKKYKIAIEQNMQKSRFPYTNPSKKNKKKQIELFLSA